MIIDIRQRLLWSFGRITLDTFVYIVQLRPPCPNPPFPFLPVYIGYFPLALPSLFLAGLLPGLPILRLRTLPASTKSAGVPGRLELTLPSVLLPPMLFCLTKGLGLSGAVDVAPPKADDAGVSFWMPDVGRFLRDVRVEDVVEDVLPRREGSAEPSSASGVMRSVPVTERE